MKKKRSRLQNATKSMLLTLVLLFLKIDLELMASKTGTILSGVMFISNFWLEKSKINLIEALRIRLKILVAR